MSQRIKGVYLQHSENASKKFNKWLNVSQIQSKTAGPFIPVKQHWDELLFKKYVKG